MTSNTMTSSTDTAYHEAKATELASHLVRQYQGSDELADAISRELHWLRTHIAEATARMWALEKHRSSPRVLVVLHYKHYTADEISDISEGQTLEQAYHQLWHLCYDNGTGAPVGVEVGGYMITWDELVAEFGEYDPW